MIKQCIMASASALAVCVVAGCAVPVESDAPVGQTEQSIINGAKDTTHDAVVAVLSNQSSCTGTIIYKDVPAKKGYVITAAHCLEFAPQVVVRGTNYQNGVQYPVIDYKAHESYNGQVYDFAMVTFTWSNNEPPMIPALKKAQDNMAPGSTVTFIGYGVTNASPGSPGNNNTTRYFVDGQLANVKALTVEYNQSNSGAYANNAGPCFGDSGGPALFTVPGVGETVAAITSYGDQNCTQYGVSGRLSAVEAWMDDYITNGGGGVGAQTCDECAQVATSQGGSCAASVSACLNNNDCSNFVQCINNCQTQTCVDNCVNQYPNGVDGYLAVLACICDVGCPGECGGEAFCQGGGPAGDCGFSIQDPTCETCFTNNCCSQGTACANDQACTECVTGQDPDPNCIDTNAKAAQLYQCLSIKCGNECGITGGGGTGGTGGSNPGTGGNDPGTGGAGVGGAGGAGVGGGDNGGSGGEGGDNGNNTVSVGSCACRTTTAPTPDSPLALAIGAMLMGLFASRRKKRN